MYNLNLRFPDQRESFVIQVRGEGGEGGEGWHVPPVRVSGRLNLNLSTMKLFSRFRKFLMRFIFSFPSSSRSSSSASVVRRQRPGDRPDTPKTSCSSYQYSPNSHYPEAIADCIEFFNKSFQEEISRKSDAQV